MSNKDEKGLGTSTNILNSPFFEPSIIEKFLQQTLSDEKFPKIALYYLMQFDEENDENIDERSNELRKAWTPDKGSPFYLNDERKVGLKDGIQALCTFLALPNDNVTTTKDDATQNLIRKIDFQKNRVLLGFCRLLNGQPTESAFEFDLVRQELYSKQQQQNRRKKDDEEEITLSPINESKEDKQIYLNALWGAELSAELIGKSNESQRYRKWRKTEMKKEKQKR